MSTQPFTSKLFRLSGLALLTLGLVSCGNTNTTSVPPSPTATTTSPPTVTPRYFCGQDAQGTYTTYAETPKGKQAIIRWKSEYFSKSGYTPEVRCQEASPRFQQAADNGQLEHITNGTQNNLPVVCSASNKSEKCGMMLFTLRPEDDPEIVRQMLIDLGKGVAMGPIPQSGSYKVYIPMSEVLKNLPVE